MLKFSTRYRGVMIVNDILELDMDASTSEFVLLNQLNRT